MPITEKVLWVAGYEDLTRLVDRAVQIGATAVAIRIDNHVVAALDRLHAQGVKVYGWRWPSAEPAAAMREAELAVHLLASGLDCYIVDAQGCAKGPGGKVLSPYDWDQPGLDDLAERFCDKIRWGAPDKELGFTSDRRAMRTFPKLSWNAFFEYATLLVPQAHWRSSDGSIGLGSPAANYQTALDCWRAAGAQFVPVIPVAGELGSVTAAEINEYAQIAGGNDIKSLHFYCDDLGVTEELWLALQELS